MRLFNVYFLNLIKIKKNINEYGYVLFGISVFFVFLFFLVVFFKINQRPFWAIFDSSPFNYFNLLAASFLDGKLSVEPVNNVTHDLSFFKGKYYLYWPPMPAIVMMPLVAIFGPGLPDKVISIFLAAANVTLFLYAIRYLSNLFNLKLTNLNIYLLGAFWGFGTCNFNVAFEGSVWYISQIISQTALLASFVCVLREKPKLFFAGIFFAVAVYTRNTMVFSGLIMLFFIFIMDKRDFKHFISKSAVFSGPFIVCSLLNLWYNFIRFGNILDNGLTKHNMGWWFKKDFDKYGFFNTHFIPKNFFYEIIKPPVLESEFPFIGLNQNLEGFGLLWLSPIFLFIPLSFIYLRKADINIRFFLLIVFSVIVITALPILMIMGRGVQFGARYSLDFHFELFILLAFVLSLFQHKKNFQLILVFIFIFTLAINTIGAYYMAIRW